MGQILTLVLPVFGLIGLGWLAARLRVLSDSTSTGVSDFVATLAIPALLFRLLSEGDVPEADPWSYWSAYFLGVALVWALAMVLARRLFAVDNAEAVFHGFAAAQANTVQLGVPLVVMVFGEAGALPMFLLIAVHLPVIMIVAAVLLSRDQRGRAGYGVRSILVSLGTNPIILSMLLGGVVRALHVPVPGLVREIVGQLAMAAAPVALVAMGMTSARYGLRGYLAPTLVVTALKMLVHPLLTWVLAYHVFDMPPVFAAVAVVFAALPTGINAYLMAARSRTGEALTSNAVSMTTLISVVTVTFWLWFIGATPP
ncbi:AEC family transporter [Pseudochelatococcus sp. B33]